MTSAVVFMVVSIPIVWVSRRSLRHPAHHGFWRFFAFESILALLKSVNPLTVTLTALATLALTVTARTEEAENVARFGDEYRDYMTRTRRFVPFLF